MNKPAIHGNNMEKQEFAPMFPFFLLAFFLLILILFCYIRIELSLELIENNTDRAVKVLARTPIKSSSKEYSLEELELKLSKLFPAQKSAEKNNGNNPENKPGLLGEDSGLKFFMDIFKESGSIMKYYELSQLFFKYLLIENLDWRSIIGMNDAMKTAIASGSLWALKGTVISQLSNKSHIDKLFLNVAPNFASSLISSRINCILKMRIAHIILVGVHYYGHKLKGY